MSWCTFVEFQNFPVYFFEVWEMKRNSWKEAKLADKASHTCTSPCTSFVAGKGEFDLKLAIALLNIDFLTSLASFKPKIQTLGCVFPLILWVLLLLAMCTCKVRVFQNEEQASALKKMRIHYRKNIQSTIKYHKKVICIHKLSCSSLFH